MTRAAMTPDGPDLVPAGRPAPAEVPAARVVAVVNDLFFVARIRETARAAGVPLDFAKTPEALEAAVATPVRFALVDLTSRLDYARVFATLDTRGIPVVAFTTHALARDTRPWHTRCARVVTKETLTRELVTFLRDGARASGADERPDQTAEAPAGETNDP